MKKLIAIQFLTLDGVVQSPGSPDEDTEGGFGYGGWQIPYFGDSTVSQELPKMGALLLGRKTYDIFAAYWPTRGKDIAVFGPFMNGIEKYVVSRTLKSADWNNTTLIPGDVVQSITQLKTEAGKDIYMFGSGNLCQTLMKHKLIDEFLLMIHPLTLGSGKKFLQPDGPKLDLELLSSRATPAGVLVLNYRIR